MTQTGLITNLRVAIAAVAPCAIAFGLLAPVPHAAHANDTMDLRRAVAITVESNPDIGQAIANREAIQFELEQARGLYLPRVDLEGTVGAGERYGNNLADRNFEQREASVVVRQLLFDGFDRRYEVHNQSSRVDGASFRVLERSEFLGLSVVRQYIEVGLRARVVELSERNLAFLRKFVEKTSGGETGGTTSVADVQQARERVFAAEAQLTEARQNLVNARIAFLKLVGLPMTHAGQIPRVPTPRSFDEAIGWARTNNPTIRFVQADLDAAYALMGRAESGYYPTVSLEGRARTGEDLDGTNGRDGDIRGSVVASWNLFRGGIDEANKQEQLRRIDEQRFKLESTLRDVEEGLRQSWDVRDKQSQKQVSLQKQLEQVELLINSYTSQFEIGRRSLLDLLNTQNARLNAQVDLETSRAAVLFADYRILAAMGNLLPTLGIEPPKHAEAITRARHRVPETPPAETERRREPRDWTITIHREGEDKK